MASNARAIGELIVRCCGGRGATVPVVPRTTTVPVRHPDGAAMAARTARGRGWPPGTFAHAGGSEHRRRRSRCRVWRRLREPAAGPDAELRLPGTQAG